MYVTFFIYFLRGFVVEMKKFKISLEKKIKKL